MVQAATQGPVTPSRQLGVARGPKRTPSSRTKKPYARPAPAAQGSSSSSTIADYQTEAAPSFLRGMRSLVARLWGTSLKSSSNATAPAPDSATASHKCTAEGNAGMRPVTESARPTAMQPTTAAADIGEETTPTIARHASTVSEYTRSRRPTAESLFAPSPFAYNKKLATATPSVAHLRDVGRVKDQSPALSRRHSVGRIDPRRPRLSAGVPLSGSQSGLTEGDDPTQYMSPSSARRLLSTLNSINTPILDARGRATPGLSATVGVKSGYQYSANIGERTSAVPLRRLPVSLLALSDTPNKTHRSPLGDPANVVDKETLRRSSSLRGTLRSQNTAPSLARTIQMKQARKAVAERLLQCQSAESSYAESDASSRSATQSPLSAAPEYFDNAAVAGSVHPREEDEEQAASKRRRASGGEAVKLSGDGELDAVDVRASNGQADRSKRVLGRRLGRAGRSLSTVDSGVKWRFSARLAPTSDDEADSGPESDEDREALTAKVPLSKIRGGELLGLSQRLTSSTQSTSSSVGYSAVRSTGFGSTRMPIPLFSEPETKEAAPTAVSASASTTAFSTTAAATAPFLTTTSATTAPTLVPATSSAAEEAAPVTKTAAPASSSLFSGISFKPVSEVAAASASKSEPEKTTAALAPAVGSTPLFSFGKPASAGTAEKPAEIPDNTSEVATAPTTPVFTFTKTSAADSTPSAKTVADTWGKSTALPSAFGVKPSTANTTGATTPELAPKPVTSAPTFSFGLNKPAAATSTADSSKPAAAPSLFSFGSAAPSAPATTTTAAATEEKPKSDVKFTFGSFGAAASSEAPNILTTKRSRGDETTESAGTAPKPAFSFMSGATGGGSGGFTLASSTSTSNAPMFGSLASKDTSSTAAPAAASAAASGFKPGGTFSFGGAAPSTSGASISFGLGSKAVPEPEKIIDTTMDSSDSMATTSAPGSNIFGSGTASAALPFGASSSKAPATSTSTFNFASSFGGSNAAKPAAGPSTTAFGGFGKSTATGSAAAEPAAKKPAFSFGAVLGTPAASSFESASIATPSATSFTSPAATAPTPAFGAAAATPSAFGFGSAASSAVTPATTGFTFGAKPALQQSNTFGSISSQLGSSSFGNASTSQTGGGNTFGSMITSQPISNGFGSTQPSQTTGNVFGTAQPSQAASSAFGSSTGGLGFGSNAGGGGLQMPSNSGQRNVSSGSFTFGNSSSSTGFGGSFTGTGGFGQQQPQQHGSSAMPSFSSQPGGFGPSAGNSAFGGASNTSAFGAGTSTGPASQFSFGQSNQTPSTAGFAFGAPAPATGSIPPTPFAFGSNASVQESGPPSSVFQFAAGGVAQHSSTGVSGGMSLGRVTGASNASATSQGRRIARPRGRRH
ncbi:hypothetical protein GGH93_000649 [Coemansia aciculifera]|nr:hypothetical protein GGH93_000649 [Coemansia aciculifera]